MNLLNDKILLNLSTIISAESLAEEIAAIKQESFDASFVYGDYRFKIVKHHINDWTIVIEDAKVDLPKSPELFLEHIGSLDFYTILTQHLR